MDFGLCHKETSMTLMEYTFQKMAKINSVDTITSKVNMFLRLMNYQQNKENSKIQKTINVNIFLRLINNHHNNKKKINKDKKLGDIIEIKYSFRK